MKKRLRKKKRLGEFQEFGFETGFRFSKELNNDSRNQFIDKFIKYAIEDNGLQFGGGGNENEWLGFVSIDKSRGSATVYHQKKVEEWYISQTDVIEYYISELLDAWYGDFDKRNKQWVRK